MQNRVWVVTGILRRHVVCGFLVFAKDVAEARWKALGVLGRIEKIRVAYDEMTLVVEEVTDFDQVFSLETFRGRAAWLKGE